MQRTAPARRDRGHRAVALVRSPMEAVVTPHARSAGRLRWQCDRVASTPDSRPLMDVPERVMGTSAQRPTTLAGESIPQQRPGSAGEHDLQCAYGTAERADRFYRDQVRDRLLPKMIEFIGRMEMMFVATSDARGRVRLLAARRRARLHPRARRAPPRLPRVPRQRRAREPRQHQRERARRHPDGRLRPRPDRPARQRQGVDRRGRPAPRPVTRELPPEAEPGRRAERWVVVEVDEAYIHCRKHIPRMAARARAPGVGHRRSGPQGWRLLPRQGRGGPRPEAARTAARGRLRHNGRTSCRGRPRRGPRLPRAVLRGVRPGTAVRAAAARGQPRDRRDRQLHPHARRADLRRAGRVAQRRPLHRPAVLEEPARPRPAARPVARPTSRTGASSTCARPPAAVASGPRSRCSPRTGPGGRARGSTTTSSSATPGTAPSPARSAATAATPSSPTRSSPSVGSARPRPAGSTCSRC